MNDHVFTLHYFLFFPWQVRASVGLEAVKCHQCFKLCAYLSYLSLTISSNSNSIAGKGRPRRKGYISCTKEKKHTKQTNQKSRESRKKQESRKGGKMEKRATKESRSDHICKPNHHQREQEKTKREKKRGKIWEIWT